MAATGPLDDLRDDEIEDVLVRCVQGKAGSYTVMFLLVRRASQGGAEALSSSLRVLLRDRGSEAVTLRPAGVHFLLSATAHSTGDVECAREHMIRWGRALIPQQSGLFQDPRRTSNEWTMAGDLAPIGWMTGVRGSVVSDVAPLPVQEMWHLLTVRSEVLRPVEFAEWMDQESRGGGTPELRASSALGAALVAYADLASWPSQNRVRIWESGDEQPPPERVDEVESYRRAIRGPIPSANFEGWNTVFGRWYLRRFLVERDWGSDSTAVSDLVEKGRVMLGVSEEK